MRPQFGSEKVRPSLHGNIKVVEEPTVCRCPRLVDTLNGSKHSNMKELRFQGDGGVWRVPFAFDPTRAGIVLLAGNKKGLRDERESKFYEDLIEEADRRFDAHLERLSKTKK